MNIIDAKNISKSYEKNKRIKAVIKNINLKIKEGSFVVIIGPSGSGKTTLLNLLSGVIPISSGELFVNNVNLTELDKESLVKFRKENISFVFQNPNLISYLTVIQNIEMGKYLSDNPLDINEIIKLMNLEKLVNKYPNNLSGGEQHKVSIARALIKNPKVLFLDEPTISLDNISSKKILSLLLSINEKYKTTIILVTHDRKIKELSDKVIELKDGKIILKTVNKIKKDKSILEKAK